MSTQEAVRIVSRAVAIYFLAWALSDISYLPQMIYSFFHYVNSAGAFGTSAYYRDHDSIMLAFHAVRIVVLFIAAQWFYRGGPSVHNFFLNQSQAEETAE